MMMALVLLDFTAFIGRFHPLLVHLPIGFLLLAVLIEWWGGKENYQNMVAFMWGVSAIGAIGAVVCGWFLANEGNYGNWSLFFHRWCGIGIAILAVAGWHYRRDKELSSGTSKLTNWLAVILLTITGHLGGNLTHGPNYLLDHAPEPIKKLLGAYSVPDTYPQYNSADSVVVFRDIIRPSLERKCMSCHNDKTQQGGLNMSTIETISEGGEGGKVIVPGDLSSELLRRVTLPVTSKKFMPTSGENMSYDEVKLLEWWIMEGADYEGYIGDFKITTSVQNSLLRLYGLDMTPRPWLEKKQVAFVSDEIKKNLEEVGWTMSQLSSSQGWLEVEMDGDNITDAQLESLLVAKEQITWLQVKNIGLTDAQLSIIGGLTHLTRLRIQYNPITDQGIQHLLNLDRLESLNLVGTQVTETVIETLGELPSLQSLYLWKSKIDVVKAKELIEDYPVIDINLGAEVL